MLRHDLVAGRWLLRFVQWLTLVGHQLRSALKGVCCGLHRYSTRARLKYPVRVLYPHCWVWGLCILLTVTTIWSRNWFRGGGARKAEVWWELCVHTWGVGRKCSPPWIGNVCVGRWFLCNSTKGLCQHIFFCRGPLWLCNGWRWQFLGDEGGCRIPTWWQNHQQWVQTHLGAICGAKALA